MSPHHIRRRLGERVIRGLACTREGSAEAHITRTDRGWRRVAAHQQEAVGSPTWITKAFGPPSPKVILLAKSFLGD
jgi:hypothetical protein